jgi:hypothetical protein
MSNTQSVKVYKISLRRIPEVIFIPKISPIFGYVTTWIKPRNSDVYKANHELFTNKSVVLTQMNVKHLWRHTLLVTLRLACCVSPGSETAVGTARTLMLSGADVDNRFQGTHTGQRSILFQMNSYKT